ncbi:MAG TPA: hypothetical protein VFA45_20710 [Actinomycetes bacterium]|nr:hypothetical protein [Actinomycetes bacterium]
MNLAVAILSTVGVFVAAGAAVGSLLAARQANRAAATLAMIERHRWHADLTPQFEVTCTATSGDQATLRVAFVGPPGLDRLDRVTVSVRDDIRGRRPVIAGGPTAEQIARQVWGPYRFVRGVDGADENGRSVAPVELLLGDRRPFALERTLPPPWWGMDVDGWRKQYADQPVRLTLTGHHQGDEPWTVPREVYVDQDG